MMLRLHFLGHIDVGVVPATFGNGSNTTMRNNRKKYRTNQLPYVFLVDFFCFFGQDFRLLRYFEQPRITRDGRTLGSRNAPKLMEMISHFI